MDMQKQDELEAAHAEIEATLNLLIELSLGDSESGNEDVARVLMRVRQLTRVVRPDFLKEEVCCMQIDLVKNCPLRMGL